MNIAIISDTHDNIPNLKKVLDYCHENRIEKMIHCGDLATLETLDYLSKNFSGEIFFTFGNMDDGHVANDLRNKSKYKKIHIFPDFGHAQIAKRKVAFVHYPDVAKQLCETGKYDFVFHGHTHKPWTEIINNCTLLNPGNVANQYFPPTFAIWDTNNNSFRLIRINELH